MKIVHQKPWLFSTVTIAIICVVYIGYIQLHGSSIAASGNICPAKQHACTSQNCGDDCPLNCQHNVNS